MTSNPECMTICICIIDKTTKRSIINNAEQYVIKICTFNAVRNTMSVGQFCYGNKLFSRSLSLLITFSSTYHQLFDQYVRDVFFECRFRI